MQLESKKIIYLQKMYNKIRKYCLMNFIYKSEDESAKVFDSLLNRVERLINNVKCCDDTLRKKRVSDIKKVEDLSKRGFSYKYIKDISKKEQTENDKIREKKEYMSKIIYDAYFKKRENDRDFGGELDIWGNSTKEFKFIIKQGFDNPYIELQNMNQKNETILSVDNTIKLIEDVVNVFEKQKYRDKLKDDLIKVFLSYDIDLL